MAEPTEDEDHVSIGKWLMGNQAKAGTPEFTEMADAYKELDRRIQARGPTGAAVRPWAEQHEAETAANADIGRQARDYARGLVRGSAVGSFGDEINAYVNQTAPMKWINERVPKWMGGGSPAQTYAQELELERARNRRFDKENPVLSPALQIGGAVAEQLAIPGLGTAYNAMSIPRRVGVDAAFGAVKGFGEGEGGPGEASGGSLEGRMWNAGKEGAMSGATSYGLNTLLGKWGKFSATTPEVDQAAQATGRDLPFFVRAQDPTVQAAGRQMAQERPGTPIAQAWHGARQAPGQAGEDIVQRLTGAPVMHAPNVAGMQVKSGMQQAGEQLTQRMDDIHARTADQMPPGFTGDAPNLRAAEQTLVGDRAARGWENPRAGLEQVANLTQPPGPWGPRVSFPGMQGFITETGQQLGAHPAVPRPISDADIAPLYAGARRDQESWVGGALGPQAEREFVQGVEEQSQLAAMRQALAKAGQAPPEAIINLLVEASTVKGGGTRLDQLGNMWRAMTPEQQSAAAGGIVARLQQMATSGDVIPSTLARRLSEVSPQALDMMFPPGSALRQQFDSLGILSGRVGAVDQMQSVGSAKTFGQKFRSLAPVGVGGLSAAGLAHAAGMTVPFLAATGAGAATRYGYGKFMKPYLLEHGLPRMSPGVQALAESLSAGTARSTPLTGE